MNKAKWMSEFLGTAFLVMIVFGSGIMGERLSNGNVAIALLANSLATGAGLFVLIQSLGSISGAHFNPVVSLVELMWGRLSKSEFMLYVFFQFTGAIIGVFLTHIMFDLDVLQLSTKVRYGANFWVAEFIGTFGLIATIALAGRKHVEFAPLAIALYITAGYWFTSSTAFVNPAVTFARVFSDTFCGMAPQGVSLYILFEILGAMTAFFSLRKL